MRSRSLDFLAAAFLALAAPALAAEGEHCVAADIVLWGDGKHDDTSALNAWFAGREAVWAWDGAPVGARIAGRSFRLSEAVYVRAGTGRRLEDFSMVWPERGETVSGGSIVTGSDPRGEPALSGVSVVGGDSREGVASDLPDPAPAASDDKASCAIS